MPGHSWRDKGGVGLDPEGVLREIGLQPGQTMLDVGCGEGRFSIPAASIVGERGSILAFDTSEDRIAALRRSIRENSLDQIEAFVAGVGKSTPVPTATVDVCLVANVLHELVENDTVAEGLQEIHRVLRADGLLAILEFKKGVGGPPGPPLSIRLSPADLESLLTQHGFELRSDADVGPFHYLSVFAPSKS